MFEAVSEIRYVGEYDGPRAPLPPGPGPTELTTSTAFETRNAGITLEVEPVVSADSKIISLSLVPQHLRLEGFHKVTIEGPGTKGRVVLEQPQFDMMKVTTSLTLRNGQRVLLGVYRVSPPSRELELFILKAEAKTVE